MVSFPPDTVKSSKMTPIALHLRSRLPNLPRASRMILTSISLTILTILIYHTRPLSLSALPSDLSLSPHAISQPLGAYRIPLSPLPSVNLVIAATSKEDYSWTKKLTVPGLVVVPYIADNLTAEHHAQKNKGHEAMMYHQYFYDYYDKLPDVSVLVHSQQRSWHVEQLLDQDMIFTLNHLDLREVQRRQFLNLRVTWGIGCSSGIINTSRVNEESGNAPEQKEMREAFRANFNLYTTPEILATPCCSQIAVTRERIRSVPREQYARHIGWLMETGLKDSISGRTWEHMWQYLFLEKAIDCPLEHKAYCRLYHICFGGREAYDEWIELGQGRGRLEKEIRKLKPSKEDIKKQKEKDKKAGKKTEEKKESETEKKAKAQKIGWLEDELRSVKEAIRVRKEVAIVRGAVEANRVAEGEDMYGEGGNEGVEKHIFKDALVTSVSAGTVATGKP